MIMVDTLDECSAAGNFSQALQVDELKPFSFR
jgi:hypothetical protein